MLNVPSQEHRRRGSHLGMSNAYLFNSPDELYLRQSEANPIFLFDSSSFLVLDGASGLIRMCQDHRNIVGRVLKAQCWASMLKARFGQGEMLPKGS